MKPTPLSLTGEEITAAHELIDAGKLDPEFFEQCERLAAENCFGVGFKTDREGFPIEVGVGSSLQPSRNSINAYKKYCKDEPDFERHLARMEKELAAYTEKRKAEDPTRRVGGIR